MTTVLLVDDEPLVLRSLAIQIRRRRPTWTCVAVDSAEQALVEIGKRAYDVIVSDMRMPGMNGPELLARAHAMQPNAKRIILSGQAEPEAMDKAAALANDYLMKPIGGEDLIRAIEG